MVINSKSNEGNINSRFYRGVKNSRHLALLHILFLILTTIVTGLGGYTSTPIIPGLSVRTDTMAGLVDTHVVTDLVPPDIVAGLMTRRAACLN